MLFNQTLLCCPLCLHFQCTADYAKYINGKLDFLSLRRVHKASLWKEHTEQTPEGSVRKQHQITQHQTALNKPVTLNNDSCFQADQV